MRSGSLPHLGFLLWVLGAVAVQGVEESSVVGKFLVFDLWIDCRDLPLAAYQVELTFDSRAVKIVGLEGGATEAFADPPYYDRAGFEAGRIIIAAFTTDDDAAPVGSSRVARLHVVVTDSVDAVFSAKLVTAVKPGGERIEGWVEVKIAEKEGKP
jgi:hypothetical protein